MHRFWSAALVVVAATVGASAARAQSGITEQQPVTPALPGSKATPGAAPQIGGAPDLLPSLATGQRGVQMRNNVLTGKALQAGPTVDFHPSVAHPETPAIASRRDETAPVEIGGFVGYLFHDDVTGAPSSSVSFDLQVATDPLTASSGWFVQPGIDYTTPLARSLSFNTRLFSTFAPEGSGSGFGSGSGSGALAVERPAAWHGGNGELGLQDVGVGLGLGYSITDNWNIQTQARYQRMLSSGESPGQEEASPHNFFGGVMVDYKF